MGVDSKNSNQSIKRVRTSFHGSLKSLCLVGAALQSLFLVLFFSFGSNPSNINHQEELRRSYFNKKAANVTAGSANFKNQRHEIEVPLSSVSNLVVFAGLVKNTSQIPPNTWKLIAELSCAQNVSILITAAAIGDPDHIDYPEKYYHKFGNDTSAVTKADQSSCAPFHIALQGTKTPQAKNRIELLGLLRDMQRKRVKELFFPKENLEVHKRSVVILADLDLIQLPGSVEIMQRVKRIIPSSDLGNDDLAPSVICAAGRIFRRAKSGQPVYTEGYSDTFATVFLPDSFAFPLKLRLHSRSYYAAENRSISDQSPKDITKYLQNLAKDHNGFAPVRSCFSGLAMYKASVWLSPLCQYSLHGDENDEFFKKQPRDNNRNLLIMRYAMKFGKLPCEHVIFHDCLHRQVFPTMGQTQSSDTSSAVASFASLSQDIVVDPTLVTYWRCC